MSELVGNLHLIDKPLNDQPIGAGAEVGALVNLKGFSRAIVMVKGDKIYDVYSTPSPNGSTMFTDLKETLQAAVAANASLIKEPTKFAPHLYISVKNTEATSGKFDVWVYGI